MLIFGFKTNSDFQKLKLIDTRRLSKNQTVLIPWDVMWFRENCGKSPDYTFLNLMAAEL